MYSYKLFILTVFLLVSLSYQGCIANEVEILHENDDYDISSAMTDFAQSLSSKIFFSRGLSSTADTTSTPTVITHVVNAPKAGPINGIFRNGVFNFMNVPFADAPRFAKPIPKSPFTTVFDATTDETKGISCMQVSGTTVIGQEDCLVLDIWAPSGSIIGLPKPLKLLPVFVWIYGGAFVSGSAGDALYNGGKLTMNENIIVVNINYRLGVLGFLALDSLGSATETVGNWGTLDQQTGIRWVYDNIEAFGGDKTNITIGGESAGAFSTCWHLAAPGSKGLFSKAIMESGNCDTTYLFQQRQVASKYGAEWATSTTTKNGPKCDPSKNIAMCLRAKDAASLVLAQSNYQSNAVQLSPAMSWGPVVDGVVMHNLPIVELRNGNGAKVPLLLGTNADEGTIFLKMLEIVIPEYITEEGLKCGLTTVQCLGAVQHFLTPEQSQNAIDKYNINDEDLAVNPSCGMKIYPKGNNAKVSQILTDYLFSCNALNVANAYANPNASSNFPAQNVYLYKFDFIPLWQQAAGLGAFHSSEIQYVFGNEFLANMLPGMLPVNLKPYFESSTASFLLNTIGWSYEARTVNNLVSSWWGGFIRNEDPMLSGFEDGASSAEPFPFPNWGNYKTSPKTSPYMNIGNGSFESTSGTKDGYYKDICAFWAVNSPIKPY